ncbi:MAG: lipopolysaccharide biosynthesis protein [Chloroflexi bacterium]|nr:lipopolysaccharide biosynthesis protein [Chloroflexota bacterium]
MQRRVIKDLLAYLPSKLLPALTAFLTVPIFTHLFAPDQYGNYNLAFGVSEFLIAGTVTGFAAAAVRFYAAYELKGKLSDYFGTIFSTTAVLTLIGAIIAAVLMVTAKIANLVDDDLYSLLWVALLLFMVTSWYTVLMHIVRAEEKSRWFTAFELTLRYGMVGIAIVLATQFDIGVSSIMWGQVIITALLMVPLFWVALRGKTVHFTRLVKADFAPFWAYALPLTIGNLAFWGLRLSDRYIVKIFHGSYEVGVYLVSYNISARSIDLIVGLFIIVPGPIIMRLWEEKGRADAEEALTAITRMFLLLVVPAVIGLAVTSQLLVRFLAEEKYYDGHKAMFFVAASSALFGLGQLGSFGILLGKKTNILARNQFVAVAISLIINLALVPWLGFMGAAIASAVAFGAQTFLQAYYSSKFLTWRWPMQTLWRVVAGSALMAVVAGLIVQFGPEASTKQQALTLLIAVSAGAAAYGITLIALGEVTIRQLRTIRDEHGPDTVIPSPSEVTDVPIQPVPEAPVEL